ncbi:MAG: hypothetical protein WC560_07830 [Syntrophales bacterium]
MITIEDVNKAFAAKGIFIELPLPVNLMVKSIEVLEKIHYTAGIRLLLRVEYINEDGKEVSELIYREGPFKKERKPLPKSPELPKDNLLPTRDKMAFADAEEAKAYLKEAITHLLQDKGYSPEETSETDLYFTKEGIGFFVKLAIRCDEKGLEKAKQLRELRRKHGPTHEYALVFPAFQDSLGLPLRIQERWIARNQDYLSIHRIGLYGVDNMDPNRIYSFSIYPKELALKRYFMITTQSWFLVRNRYVQERPFGIA